MKRACERTSIKMVGAARFELNAPPQAFRAKHQLNPGFLAIIFFYLLSIAKVRVNIRKIIRVDGQRQNPRNQGVCGMAKRAAISVKSFGNLLRPNARATNPGFLIVENFSNPRQMLAANKHLTLHNIAGRIDNTGCFRRVQRAFKTGTAIGQVTLMLRARLAQ